MAQRIKEKIANQKPDIVIASQLGTALYRPMLNATPLFGEVACSLTVIKMRIIVRRLRNRLTWMKHRRYLANLLGNYQACTVVSDREKQLLLNLNPNNRFAEIIPNCIDINDYKGIKEIPHPETLIFTGSFNYFPNYEGMVWFMEKVFPKIKTHCPSIKLIITGDHAGRQLPPSANIILTGFVNDIRPLIARSSISIVPIHAGGGTRIKS
jgi:glycosyltransferase involved in cell wall biosynthesis